MNLGRHRTFGALALVFRGSTLRELLGDPDILRRIKHRNSGTDTVVGEWALKRGIGIACHTPSLMERIGTTSSPNAHIAGRAGQALAIAHTGETGSWRPAQPKLGRVGLIGWNIRTGVGYQNRDIAVNLPVTSWLAPVHEHFGRREMPAMAGHYWAPDPRKVSRRELRNWLSGLDWLVFVEETYIPGLPQLAKEMGVSVACVPNWEWLSLSHDWLSFVDMMICPTACAFRMLVQWRADLGFAWDVVHVPWPIDAARFTFRRRERCDRFLFVNGMGGVRASYLDDSETSYRRKGGELIAATARLMKSVPFLVYSQVDDPIDWPANVEVRPAPRDNRELYFDGDVCVQPSHFEGLGLQHLECQAAGLPLVTTDAPPMNECRPYRTVPVDHTELVFTWDDHPVDSNVIKPEDLVTVLDQIYRTDIGEASQRAHDYIMQERSWARARAAVAAYLTA